MIEALDAAVGPIKQRERWFEAGELLTGIAAAQLAGEDFLTGLDRQLTATAIGLDVVHGHGVRGGKAMIVTLRWRLIAVPGRLTRRPAT